ncbi:Arm DNA-binding domain-containing protein [Bradyrhizobium sp. UFLA05-112]
MAKLTNGSVRTLSVKGTDTLYADTEVPGLYLRVRAGGSRTFIIQWRQGQFQRRSTVGKVGVLTVDEARKKARKLLVGIDEGNDPVAVKAKGRADDKQLFGLLAEEYLDLRAKDMKPQSLEQTSLHLRNW